MNTHEQTYPISSSLTREASKQTSAVSGSLAPLSKDGRIRRRKVERRSERHAQGVHRVPEVVRAVWTAIDTAEVWKSSRHIRGSALLGHISSPTTLLSLPEYMDVSQADVIVRSSDHVDFPVHEAILATSSSAYNDIFSLAQPSNETVDVLPIVQLSEGAGLVRALITALYPISFETVTPTSYYRILALLAAAQKYEMGTVQSSIRAEVGRERLSQAFSVERRCPVRMPLRAATG
ncbi:hypothetical protein EDB84DRAFT_1192180 [Lactarius hengduanensis]|nr:hypothetical protein EDB84DRAFT_1192180 [Lactarius hengduanensis]